MDVQTSTNLGNRLGNEDALGYKIIDDRALFVLCDGVGGESHGEVASALVKDSLLDDFAHHYTKDFLDEAILHAQERLLEKQKEEHENGMKTTLTVLLIEGHVAQYAHVGDSRIYHFEKDKIVSRTMDHSVAQMLVLSGDIKEKHLTKPLKGQFKKAGVDAVKLVREFRLKDKSEFKVGDVLGVDTFAAGDLVDVTGTSKGKGFAGTIKRHGFARGPMGHGSKSHREPGSTGAMISGPGGRVLKGKKLPGHMGHERVTVQRLTVVRVDADRNIILVKGAIPGPKKGFVMIKSTVKPNLK